MTSKKNDLVYYANKEQFKALTDAAKQYTNTLKEISHQKTTTEKAEGDDDDGSKIEPKPKKNKTKEDSPFVCEGLFWRDPPTGCIDDRTDDRHLNQQGVIEGKKKHYICKGCKLERDREKRAKKRQQQQKE